MTIVTNHLRRPSDAELEEAREAVIDAARRFKAAAGPDLDTDSRDAVYEWRGIVNSVGQLDVIERQRNKHLAIIEGERLTGWNVYAVMDAVDERIGETGDWSDCGYELEGDRCAECGNSALKVYRTFYSFPNDTTPHNLAECQRCGFTYEW